MVADLITYLIGKPYYGYVESKLDDDDGPVAPHAHTSKNKNTAHLQEKEVCPGNFFDPEIETVKAKMKPDDYQQFLTIFQKFLNYYPDEKK